MDAAGADRPPPPDEAIPADAAPEAPKTDEPKADSAKPPSGAADASSAPPPPALDPLLVQKTVDVSAEEPADGRTRLGLRLAAVAQGPDEPWLLAVVNRGTEPARVLFDLRLLSLEVTPPEPAATDKPKKAKPKPPKPVTCKLPANARPDVPKVEFEVLLAPGDGVVDSFDPRLYCFSKKQKALLVGGAKVTAHLGFPEKTKTLWKKGKRETVVVEQTHPFVAKRATPVPDLEKLGEEPARDPGPGAPSSDKDAVKELIAPALEIATRAVTAEPPPSEPFQLVATDGSDAVTSRQVTVAVSIINRGKEPRHLYFRREGLSFKVSGPSGVVRCEPGPDVRAPDRQSFSSVKPGGRVSAVSRLIELCPDGTFDDPGLYLIDSSFEATRTGANFGFSAYTGSIEGRAPVAVRVQQGPRPYLPQHPPLMVRVGQPQP
jgi:hypothetical protein